MRESKGGDRDNERENVVHVEHGLILSMRELNR